ncbi:MAG TPA: nucleotidyl transferase AbiEii/AbiGii toxin family protein [Acidimicrobiales bacterium]|nr:nucleotidyl transferase AbiEii/AbiGii toxin family protein [Acidimicrobiales bacterium]
MDDFQYRLVRVGLGVLGDYGFALAGGYALQAHHLVDRLSEDVDMFTDNQDPERFSQAVVAVAEAYRQQQLEVNIARQVDTFARLEVSDPTTGQAGSVDLAGDYRHEEPVRLSVGPVLAEADAVATKVAAVFSRGYARDYLDLAGILDSGRYSRETLIDLAASADAGFSRGWFAEALAAVDRFEDDQFLRYGVGAERVAHVRALMRDWSREMQDGIAREEGRQPGVGPDLQSQGPGVNRDPARPRQPFRSPLTTGPSGGHESPSRGPEIGF